MVGAGAFLLHKLLSLLFMKVIISSNFTNKSPFLPVSKTPLNRVKEDRKTWTSKHTALTLK